jgi:hypothetical protein
MKAEKKAANVRVSIPRVKRVIQTEAISDQVRDPLANAVRNDVDATIKIDVTNVDEGAAYSEQLGSASGNRDDAVECGHQANASTDNATMLMSRNDSSMVSSATVDTEQHQLEKNGVTQISDNKTHDTCTSVGQHISRSSVIASLAAEIARQKAAKYLGDIMPLAGPTNNRAAPQDRGDTLNDVDINQQDEMTSTSERPRNNLAVLAAEVARKKLKN